MTGVSDLGLLGFHECDKLNSLTLAEMVEVHLGRAVDVHLVVLVSWNDLRTGLDFLKSYGRL